MKVYIITTIVGCFGVDEKNKILDFKPFPKTPEAVARSLNLSRTKLIDEEKELVNELKKKGYTQFIFQSEKEGFEGEPDSSASRYILENLRTISIERKIFNTPEEFNKFLIDANIEITRMRIRASLGQDKVVIQAVSALEELDKSLNIFMERLREMYSLHFPELDKLITNHEKYARLVVEYGDRKNFKDPNLKKLSEISMGMEFTKEDIEMIKRFSKRILELYALRKEIESYVEEVTKKIAPNTAEIAGPMLAAKLIAKAGNLEKLAKSTSSTIQLLGAEKSLFRFLHGKGKSPRFGILATHPLVQSAPEKLKGRIARAIASKLSIAARVDYYSKEYMGDKMKKDLQERIKEILSSGDKK